MQSWKKKLAVFAGAALLGTSIAGCGSADNEAAETDNPLASDSETETSLDLSKKVELEFYMLGDAPQNLDLIEAEVNKLALAELNATVNFTFSTWTDWEQKYKLLLASGQQVDLLFTADWTQYQSFAKKGAFLPLDELLPKAAPKLQAYVPQEMWDAVRINGNIYTVPSTWKEYINPGIAYREDLRKKYNLPKPESLETLEAYLDGIKQNEPTMIPIADPGSTFVKGFLQLRYKLVNADGISPYGIYIMYDSPGEVIRYWGSEEHLEDLKIFKRWMDKGFWQRNVLSQKDSANSMLQSGKAAVILAGENPTKFHDDVVKMKANHPEWELGYFPYPNIKGFSQPVHPIHNGFAIPKASRNPERALAFYEKLVTDKRYNWLTQYGIEGTHFEVENGYYKQLEGSKAFPREGMNGWAWRNPEYMLYSKSFDSVKQIFSELEKIERPDIYTGFAEDWTHYQAEKAALEQVEKQYLYPLNVGLIEDVEGGLKIFMEKAEQAGLLKVQQGFREQWLNYIDEIEVK